MQDRALTSVGFIAHTQLTNNNWRQKLRHA